MRKTSLLITLVVLFTFVTGVLAQEAELPDPGLTPDSPFYFMEIIVEKVGTFFTFGDLKKAERHTALAAERVAEAKAMADKGKTELVAKTLKKYEKQLEKAVSRAVKAKTKGKNTKEVAIAIIEATQKHFTVLEKVLEKAPKEAKSAIEHAMTASVIENERALEALSEKAKDAFGFESLTTQCLEAGIDPEYCASLKARCIEAGATTSEKCEQVLSTSRLEPSSQRSLSE